MKILKTGKDSIGNLEDLNFINLKNTKETNVDKWQRSNQDCVLHWGVNNAVLP